MFYMIKKKAIILITTDVDFMVLKLLNHLVYVSGFQILIHSMTTRYFETNYYIWGNQGKVQDLNSLQAQVCFLFSCNLRTESLLLNTKLRSYYVSKGLKFYSFSNFLKELFQ